MIILGLLLLAGAATLTTAVILSNTGAVDVDLWGLSISDTSLGSVFAAGAITAAVGLLGMVMLLGGTRRHRRLRRERRALARDHRRLTEHPRAQTDPGTGAGGGLTRTDGGTAPGAHAGPDVSTTPAATGTRAGLLSGRSRARHRHPADTEPTRKGTSV